MHDATTGTDAHGHEQALFGIQAVADRLAVEGRADAYPSGSASSSATVMTSSSLHATWSHHSIPFHVYRGPATLRGRPNLIPFCRQAGDRKLEVI